MTVKIKLGRFSCHISIDKAVILAVLTFWC
jgi:hypothetical protein